MNNITWHSTDGEVGDDVISYIEEVLGVKFPKDFIRCAKFNNGGYPSLEAFDFSARKEAVFNRLLSFQPDRSDYILNVFHGIRDRLVDGIIPFADDPFGNHLCFDYRTSKEKPSVVFWDHEIAFLDSANGLFPVCETFSELMSRLYD